MKTLRKTTIATLAGLGILAAAAAAATPALSHGPGQAGPGYGPGYGMMGGGMMGGGMMGPGAYGGQRGFGPGMMGPGHGPGMMGHGPGFGFGPCAQQAAAVGEPVGVDDVTQRMERWLAIQGNDRLKLGNVEAVDDDTITAEIVTVDGSLVQKFTIDRNTGWTQPAK